MTGDSKLYEIKKGQRILFLIIGIFFFGVMCVGIREILIGNAPESDAGKYVVYFFMAFFFVFGSWAFALSYMKKALKMEKNRLIVYGLFKTKVFEKEDIISYSAYNQVGVNRVLLHLSDHEGKVKKVSIDLLFRIDQPFEDWFDGIPHKNVLEE